MVDLFSWFMQIGYLAKLNEELKQERVVITYGGDTGCVCGTLHACKEKWRPCMSSGFTVSNQLQGEGNRDRQLNCPGGVFCKRSF